MSDDIVARLRQGGIFDDPYMLQHAAEEIERLRADIFACRNKTIDECADWLKEQIIEVFVGGHYATIPLAEKLRALKGDSRG